MAFSFGFAGDDIDIDDLENNSGIPDVIVPQGTANPLPELVLASQHDMNELVRLSLALIHTISYLLPKTNCRTDR